MAALAFGSVIIRFVFKIFIAKLQLGLDDWFILASITVVIPSAVVAEIGTTANGLGKDIWTLSPDTITKFGMYFWVMAWLYFLEITLTKLSMLFFYLRIFTLKGVQRLLWGTVVFTSLYGVAYVLTAIFECNPISYFWTKWDGLHHGVCVDINAIIWSHAAISIALDFWMLAIPLWQLWRLQLHWRKKASIALMFCVGTL